MKPQLLKGLELDAYCHLFWVMGMQWRPQTYRDERQEHVGNALQALLTGGSAMQ